MDVENKSVPEVDISSESGKEGNSDDEVEIIPVVTPTAKTPCTPVNGESKSPKTPTTASKKRKRLSSKEREEREKDRQEKRAKLEEEKQRKEEEKQRKEEERQRREEERKVKLQQKEEERQKREEERKKKQEEDEKRKKEKEEEKRMKEEEKKKKLDEEERRKKEKEEERLKKQEEKDQERIKREQEKQQKLEEREREQKKNEEKIAKQAKLFQNFFQKSPATVKPSTSRTSTVNSQDQSSSSSASSSDSASKSTSNPTSNQNVVFQPIMFEVKSNMGLAPTLRRSKLTSEEISAFDRQCFRDNVNVSLSTKDLVVENLNEEPMDIDGVNQNQKQLQKSSSYLLHLKQNGGRKYGRTDCPNEVEIQIISNKIIENPKAEGLVKWRYKLLQFCENQRPPYWGTWKKLSTLVRPRRPWAQEKEVDYDFDSDEEWEEEPEDAEDLANSDKEDDRENDSEEDDEDGWLVPHGYVSDDEGANDEHLDKEDLKLKEKDYFDGLKKQIKINLPEIQTDRFAEFRIIFSPLTKKWKETCATTAVKAAVSLDPVPLGLDDVVELPE